MPTIAQEQIDEIQHEMADLIEQLNEALEWKEKYLELKAEYERVMSDRSLTV